MSLGVLLLHLLFGCCDDTRWEVQLRRVDADSFVVLRTASPALGGGRVTVFARADAGWRSMSYDLAEGHEGTLVWADAGFFLLEETQLRTRDSVSTIRLIEAGTFLRTARMTTGIIDARLFVVADRLHLTHRVDQGFVTDVWELRR